jgi:hypothetical protein
MRVENAVVEKYGAYLKDKYRPPSQGGNTRAWHQHVLTIEGRTYSFLALGARKWVYSGDVLSFDWEWDESQRYRNILADTIKTRDKYGNVIVRGERSSKPWRTATTRLPASRREQRD